jgi:choloylglycine hydrolase
MSRECSGCRDFTPPSRFVCAVAFSQSVFPSKTGEDAIVESFPILNYFDIPKGAAREHERDEHGNVVADYTIWTSASDLKARRLFSTPTRTVRSEWWTS